ncbi:hypothetical protein EV401DRAFT_1884065 [Pisolithus croceorrhizus]|nr:hypothetical protein EV401DRAFT_1884065 [Pisolithus croceorrhizus]
MNPSLLESLLSNVGECFTMFPAGSSPVMVTDAVPLDNADTAPTAAPANTILMDEADATPIATPTNTIPMDVNATTDAVMNANTMLSAIPANTPPTPATLADTMPMEADTSLAAVPASTIPMDVNTMPVDAGTRPTPAILTDDNTLDLSLVPTSSNFKELTPGADDDQENASPPPKVLLREVDHLNALRTQVYGLRNSLYHQVTNFNILEGRFRQKESGLSNLEAQIRNKDVVITEQAQLLSQLRQGLEEVKQQTAAQSSVLAQARLKDATIVQQSQALQKLQRDLGEVQDHVLLEAKAEIQQLQVDRESEILALNDKYEMTLHQLQESPSVAQEERDQEQSEAPVSVSLNPSNHTLREMNTDPPLTSSTPSASTPSASMPSASSTPSRRGRRKNQESRKEIETEKQRIQNLAHVRDLFKTAFKVTQDEDFLQCGGASSQVTKAFVQGTGPGPDPSHLQWDFNHPASSPWNQAVISQLMCLLVDMQQNWTVETRSDEYWTGKIKQKFARIKRRVDRAKPRVRDDLSVETNAEVAARLANHKDETLMKARRDMRRRTKYQCRKDVTKAMVAVKEAKGDDDIVAWRFLHSVITKLGSDGMSSEDSDGKDTETIFCMHTLPWRRDIVKELNLIDQRRLQDSSIFSPRGAKAAKCIVPTKAALAASALWELGTVVRMTGREELEEESEKTHPISSTFCSYANTPSAPWVPSKDQVAVVHKCDVFFFPFYAKEAFGTTRASVGGMHTSYSITVNPATPSNFPLPSYQNRVQRLALHEIGGVLIVLFLHLLSTAENRIRCSGYTLVSQ